MVDVKKVAKQVKENCAISDARNWGDYPLCILLLKCRELYKWEKGIEPWEKVDNFDIIHWIDERERKWKVLAEGKFKNIEIDRKNYPPFEIEGINKLLKPKGFIYGAGYVAGLKPSFFLGELKESRKENGYRIYILGKELARDLTAAPALLQGANIFARREPMRFFLWDKIDEFKATRRKTLKHAFEDYGLGEKEIIEAKLESIKDEVERIGEEELESYLYHEIGEASDRVFPDKKWRELIGDFPYTKIEKFVRGVKDILGDTNEKGMLRYIIDHEKKGSLSFYVSYLSGFRKVIFPEIDGAYWRFRETGDWGVIKEARGRGYERAKEYALKLIGIYDKGKAKGKEWMKVEINKELIEPLEI